MALSDAELLAMVEEQSAEAEETTEEVTEEVTDESTDAETQSEDVHEEETDEEVEETSEAEDESDDDGESSPRTFTVKVDGEEVEVTEEELLKGYSTNKAAQQKFQDAALARKQAEEFINILKTNPMDVLTRPELGIDVRAMAEQYLAEQIQYEQLSDEQRELIQARQQLAQVEQERRLREQQEHEANLAQLTAQYQDEYNKRINTALTDAGLPVTEATIRRMAGYMSEALGSDDPAIKKLNDSDIVELVREDYIADFKQMFGTSDAETLTNILGADVAKKLREADIAKVKGKQPSRTQKPIKGKPRGKEEPKKMTTDEWNEYLDSF